MRKLEKQNAEVGSGSDYRELKVIAFPKKPRLLCHQGGWGAAGRRGCLPTPHPSSHHGDFEY